MDKIIADAKYIGADSIFVFIGECYYLKELYPLQYSDGRPSIDILEHLIESAHENNITVFNGVKLNFLRSYNCMSTYMGTSYSLKDYYGNPYSAADRWDWIYPEARTKWINLMVNASLLHDFDGLYVDEMRAHISSTKYLSYSQPTIDGVIAEHGYDPRDYGVNPPTSVQLDMLHEREKALTQLWTDLKSNLSAKGANYTYPYHALIALEYVNGFNKNCVVGTNCAIYGANITDWSKKGIIDWWITQTTNLPQTLPTFGNKLTTSASNTPEIFHGGVLYITYSSIYPSTDSLIFDKMSNSYLYQNDFEFVYAWDYLNNTCTSYSGSTCVSRLSTTPRNWLHQNPTKTPRNFNPIGLGSGDSPPPAPSASETNPTASYSNNIKQNNPTGCFQTYTTTDSCLNVNFVESGNISNGNYRSILDFADIFPNNLSNASLVLTYRSWASVRENITVVEIYNASISNQMNYTTYNNKGNGAAWSNLGGDWIDKNGVSNGNTPYCTIIVPVDAVEGEKFSCDITQLVQENPSKIRVFMKASNTNESEPYNYIYFDSFSTSNLSNIPTITYGVSGQISPDPYTVEEGGYAWDENEPNEPFVQPSPSPESNPNISFSNNIKENNPTDCFQTTAGACTNVNFLESGHITNGVYRSLLHFNNAFPSNVSNASIELTLKGVHVLRNGYTVIEFYNASTIWQTNYTTYQNHGNGAAWANPGGDWTDKNNVSNGNTPYCSFVVPVDAVAGQKFTCNITELVASNPSNVNIFLKAGNTNESEPYNYIYFDSFSTSNLSNIPTIT